MRTLMLLAGAAALGVAAPALSEPKPGKGHGKNHSGHVMKGKVHKASKSYRNWTSACPRGLVWRGASCIPPGQAKKLLGVGTRVPTGWSYTPWGRVPTTLRDRYDLDQDYRYIYRDNVIYVVDPRTQLISSIISAVL